MRRKTANPPPPVHPPQPITPRDGLIAKKKKQKQSVKEGCVLDNHSHRTDRASAAKARTGEFTTITSADGRALVGCKRKLGGT